MPRPKSIHAYAALLTLAEHLSTRPSRVPLTSKLILSYQAAINHRAEFYAMRRALARAARDPAEPQRARYAALYQHCMAYSCIVYPPALPRYGKGPRELYYELREFSSETSDILDFLSPEMEARRQEIAHAKEEVDKLLSGKSAPTVNPYADFLPNADSPKPPSYLDGFLPSTPDEQPSDTPPSPPEEEKKDD